MMTYVKQLYIFPISQLILFDEIVLIINCLLLFLKKVIRVVQKIFTMDSVLRKVQERLKMKIMRGSERGGAKYFSTSRRGEGSELQADLNSNSLPRQKTAVKRIIANMSLGREVSYLFVDVVKLGATHNL